jgi:hypothetical protein
MTAAWSGGGMGVLARMVIVGSVSATLVASMLLLLLEAGAVTSQEAMAPYVLFGSMPLCCRILPYLGMPTDCS